MTKDRHLLTRREACAVLGALGLGTLGLTGCDSAASDPTTRTGFASDTEVKTYPVHLKIYADSYIQWHLNPYREPPTHLEAHMARYQEQEDRAGVTFEVVYVPSAELLSMLREGFPDGDGLLAFRDMVEEGCVSGTVDGGVGALSVRDLGYHYSESVCVVRARGSEANLPPAATLTGEDTPNGSMNRLQQLPHFDGLIALADPDATLEGLLANRALAREGLYSTPTGIGGALSEEVAPKIALYPDQDAAMAAVVAGECQLGFALETALAVRYPDVEEAYRPSGGRIFYDGAALANSPEPGVMRDFFTFETELSD